MTRIVINITSYICPHNEIVPSRHFPDGSVDGRCVHCNSDGFPVVDKAYERFLVDWEKEKQQDVEGIP